MPTSTYIPIATTTLGSAAASYTFSSIPGTYTDLIIIGNGGGTVSGDEYSFRFNGDTGSNYSFQGIGGNASAPFQSGASNQTYGNIDRAIAFSASAINSSFILHVMNYSNSSYYKSTVSNCVPVTGTYKGVETSVNTWRNTAAITSITILTTGGGGNFVAGSTFTLYGIL